MGRSLLALGFIPGALCAELAHTRCQVILLTLFRGCRPLAQRLHRWAVHGDNHTPTRRSTQPCRSSMKLLFAYL